MLASITHHDEYFCSMLDLIPRELYFHKDDDDDTWKQSKFSKVCFSLQCLFTDIVELFSSSALEDWSTQARDKGCIKEGEEGKVRPFQPKDTY